MNQYSKFLTHVKFNVNREIENKIKKTPIILLIKINILGFSIISLALFPP